MALQAEASLEKYGKNLEDVCPMPCGQNQPLLCRSSSPFLSALGIGGWDAIPSLLPLGPCSYWGYASPPRKPLESKVQRDSLMGGSGAKGGGSACPACMRISSNTQLWSDTYCPCPEVLVPALGMPSLVI